MKDGKKDIKKGGKTSIRRHAIMGAGPDQVNQVMKTFMKLEGIKKAFVPTVYAEDGRWQNVIETAQAKRAEEPDSDRFFWLIAMACISIGESRLDADNELSRISAVIKKLEKKHGLKDSEIWLKGEAPVDVEEQRAKWEKRADQIVVNIMRKYGEDAMADSFLADTDSFYGELEKAINSLKDFVDRNTGS
jgi:hypothetical protein